jgi:hypothetical protein
VNYTERQVGKQVDDFRGFAVKTFGKRQLSTAKTIEKVLAVA